ncbi:MAG: MFS transporter [Bacillota bacterium]|nr:MFS transporter [Bacillota bacterium]
MQINEDKYPPYTNSRGNWILFFGSVYFFIANLFASIAVLPGYSLAIGSTAFQAGLQNTVFGLAAIILRLLLGPVMDRQGPKPLMLIGVITFTTGPLLLMLHDSYFMLLAVRIYQSFGLAVFLPGISTLLADMAPMKKIGLYLGMTRIFFNIGLLTGASAALTIIERYSYNHWFFVSALTSAISLVLLAVLKVPGVKIHVNNISGIWNRTREVLQNKQIYPIIGGIALFSINYSAVISFSAVYIDENIVNGTAARFFIILGFTGIISCLLTGILTDRFGRQKVVWPMLVLVGLGTGSLYLIAYNSIFAIVAALLLGIGIQGSSLSFTAWLIKISNPELRATTISLQENTIDTFFALGPVIFGLAAQGPGLDSAFLAAGILTLLAILPLRKSSRAITVKDYS